MAWIKRNLFFVSGAVIALALMGFAFVFLYSNYAANDKAHTELGVKYKELQGINSITPPPSDENIKLAREQQAELAKLSQRMTNFFKPIPPIPDTGNRPLRDQEFVTAFPGAIDALRQAASRAGVVIPTNYFFTFSAYRGAMTISSPGLLAVQLGEVKAICDVINGSRANYLDRITRERVCPEDRQGFADYHEFQTVTNELAAIAPYQVELRCFSAELGKMLAGFANSPHPMRVLKINLEPTPGTLGAAPAPVAGRGVRGGGAPAYTTVIDENLIKVTLFIEIVKLKAGTK